MDFIGAFVVVRWGLRWLQSMPSMSRGCWKRQEWQPWGIFSTLCGLERSILNHSRMWNGGLDCVSLTERVQHPSFPLESLITFSLFWVLTVKKAVDIITHYYTLLCPLNGTWWQFFTPFCSFDYSLPARGHVVEISSSIHLLSALEDAALNFIIQSGIEDQIFIRFTSKTSTVPKWMGSHFAPQHSWQSFPVSARTLFLVNAKAI